MSNDSGRDRTELTPTTVGLPARRSATIGRGLRLATRLLDSPSGLALGPVELAGQVTGVDNGRESDTRPTAIIIDDDADLVSLFTLLLSHCGLNIVGSAGDGVVGADLALRTRPDLIVMNGHMPRMEGIAATARIKAEWGAACIVISSGAFVLDPPNEYAEAARRAGAAELIVPPFDADEVLEVFRRVLATRGIKLNSNPKPARPATATRLRKTPLS